MRWVFALLLLATTIQFTFDTSDPYVIKSFVNDYAKVIDGGEYWIIAHKNNTPFLGYAYWDLYIPQAEYSNVTITFKFSQDFRTYIQVYCTENYSYVWSVKVLENSVAPIWSSRDLGIVDGYTVSVTIPKGHPWVRVMVKNNDIYDKGYVVKLWKEGTIEVEGFSPTLLLGIIGLIIGLALLIYSLRKKKKISY